MAKKSKSVEVLDGMEYKPRVNVPVGKSIAKKISVGDSVTCSVSGKVCAISSQYGKEDMFDLSLDDGKVIEIKSNQADKSLKKLMGK